MLWFIVRCAGSKMLSTVTLTLTKVMSNWLLVKQTGERSNQITFKEAISNEQRDYFSGVFRTTLSRVLCKFSRIQNTKHCLSVFVPQISIKTAIRTKFHPGLWCSINKELLDFTIQFKQLIWAQPLTSWLRTVWWQRHQSFNGISSGGPLSFRVSVPQKRDPNAPFEQNLH